MKKAIIVGFLVATMALAVFLLPSQTVTTSAYPQNLWTSQGIWSAPSSTQKVLRWERTKWGYPYAWIIYDKCTTEESWYTRIEERSVILYMVSAGALGACAIFAFMAISRKI